VVQASDCGVWLQQVRSSWHQTPQAEAYAT
jgi:hypothetical protein